MTGEDPAGRVGVAPIPRIALQNELTAESGSVVNIELFGHAFSKPESLALLVAFGAVMLRIAIHSFHAGR